MKKRTSRSAKSILEMVVEALFLLLEVSFGGLLFILFSDTMFPGL